MISRFSGESENLGADSGSETRSPCHFTIQRFIFFIHKMNALDLLISLFLSALIFYNYVIV